MAPLDHEPDQEGDRPQVDDEIPDTDIFGVDGPIADDRVGSYRSPGQRTRIVDPPSENLVSATDRNKEMAFEFIDNIIAEGETDPSKALQRAFACRTELIYLLTDGEFDRAIVGQVKDLNRDGRVTVHTIGFLYRIGEVVLKQIADENSGNYKFVSERDLEALVR